MACCAAAALLPVKRDGNKATLSPSSVIVAKMHSFSNNYTKAWGAVFPSYLLNEARFADTFLVYAVASAFTESQAMVSSRR